MKYESNILKRLIDTYGVVGNPRYLSEIIKEFIVRGKELYPQLFTYQADWLAHIDEFGLTTEYVVSYTGQQIYAPHTKERPVKRAILKGSTKYRDIDTGEFLETFEEGRNLELVSVKMPVLTTIGKNLFNKELIVESWVDGTTGIDTGNSGCYVPIRVSGAIAISGYTPYNDKPTYVYEYDGNGKYITRTSGSSEMILNLNENTELVKVGFFKGTVEHINSLNIQVEKGTQATPYEPYKSNILTVNEDVTLRSNGSVYDELDLLTGKLTQRIDEDGEVLAKEVIKTVDLTVKDQNDIEVSQLISFNGGTHFSTLSQDGSLQPTIIVDVVTDLEETLNLCSMDGNTL